MQKRLLALVATVAIVLSMFAGVAFAADDFVRNDSNFHQDPGLTGAIKEGGLGEVVYKVDGNTLTIYAPYSQLKEYAEAGTTPPSAAKWLGVEIGKHNLAATTDNWAVKLNGAEKTLEPHNINPTGDALWFYYGARPEGFVHELEINWDTSQTGDDAVVENLTVKYINTDKYINTEKVVTPDVVDVAARRISDTEVELTEDVAFTFAKNIAAKGNVAVITDAIAEKKVPLAYAQITDPTKATKLTIKAGTVLQVKDGYAELTASLYDGNYSLFDAKLIVRPTIGSLLDAPTYTWPVNASKVKAYSYKGVYTPKAEVALYQNGQIVEKATVPTHGVFEIEVANPVEAFVPGPLYLVALAKNSEVVAQILAKGEVKANELDSYRIEVDRAEFVEGIDDQPFEFKVDVSELAYADGAKTRVQVEFEDDDAATVEVKLDDEDNVKGDMVTLAGNFTPDERGTTTAAVNVQVQGSDGKWYTAYTNDVDFTVKRAGTVVVSGLPKDGQLQLGIPTLIDPKVQYRNATYEGKDIELRLSGAGFNKTITAGTEITPEEFGDIDVLLTAKNAKGDIVYTTKYVWQVVGVKVELSDPVLAKGKTADLIVKVTDQDGKAINNADVEVVNGDYKRTISAGSKNIVDGEYKVSFKGSDLIINQGGRMEITVKTTDYEDITVYALVLGDEAYTVTLDDAFLRGVAHKASVAVKEDGKAVSPSYFLLRPDGKFADKAGVSSGKLSVAADVEAGEYKLYAISSNGKYGVASYEVVDPIIDLDVEKVTDKVTSSLTFKLLDPTDDNAVLDWDIVLVVNDADIVEATQGNTRLVIENNEILPVPSADNVYTVDLLLNADFKAAAKADAVPHVAFEVGDGIELGTVVEIGEAEFSVVPDNPVAGVNTDVTFKLVDANGNGLEGYEILRGTNKLGKTNEDGELVYSARFADVATFTVALDVEEENLEVTVTPGADDEAPAIDEIPETVDKAAFELVITDNVKVTKVFIDGEPVFFVPGAEVKIPLTLKQGENKFRITAADAADNYVDEVITINYVPAGVKLTIGKTEYVANGETKTMEAAPYLKGDHTMIPVRALETFGVKYAWDQDTKTATFELDENVVKVTVGSTTAIVNGEQAVVPVAPEIVNNRTMAPLRFVLQNLGLKVHWVPGGEITITR